MTPPNGLPANHAVPRAVHEAEMAVLGCMLIDDEAARAAAAGVAPRDFHAPEHRKAFNAACRILERDAAPDLVTLGAELRRTDELGAAGGAAHLADCVHSVSTTAHLPYYLRLVREASLDRQVTAQLARTAADKTPENVKRLGELIVALGGVHQHAVFDFRKDLGAALLALMESRPTTLDTGFAGLDAVVEGYEPGDVCTVGARTSGGKTALMTKIALNMAAAGAPVLYLTTEMTEYQMVYRVLPIYARVPAVKFRRRNLNARDKEVVVAAAKRDLEPLPVMVYGKSRPAFADVQAVIAQAKPRVVFIDYLQRCRFPDGDSMTYRIQEFMVMLKSYAQDAGVTAFVGCQLDRQRDKTAGTPPTLADLKDSGAIEAESDQVILLWRPPDAHYAKRAGWTPPASGQACLEAIVAKNRHGPANVAADLLLDGDFVDVVERLLTRRAEQEDLI